ncbi:MAG: EthD domain-containing protein [Dehalococcoidia bacterium]
MVTQIGYLKRQPGVTREEFQKWWIERHVPYVKQIPGLRRYVVHVSQKGFEVVEAAVVLDPLAGPTGNIHDDPEFEGIAELWFDDEEAVARAWSSQKGVEDLAHFSKYIGQAGVVIALPRIMIPGPQEPFPVG